MINLIDLINVIPELFFSICILAQLLFGVDLVIGKEHRQPSIMEQFNGITKNVMICLLIIYGLELYSIIFLKSSFFSTQLNGAIVASKFIISLVSFGILTNLNDSLTCQNINRYEYYIFYQISVLCFLLMVGSKDLLTIYLTMEAQTLCFYVLASSKRNNIFSVESGLKYFVSGGFFSGIFLLGISVIYGVLGTTNLNEIQMLLTVTNAHDYGFIVILESELILGFSLMLCTFLFKLAVAPFHFWMPDVYEGAPTGSTMVFSILTKYPYIIMLLKMVLSSGYLFDFYQTGLIYIGTFSVLFGTFYAFRQQRVKRLLLYSSVAQIGFVIAAIGVGGFEGYSAATFFGFIYIITSFLIWGLLIHFHKAKIFITKSKDDLYIETMHVDTFCNIIYKNATWFFIVILVFFSIAGLPPLTGFTSKFIIFSAIILNDYMMIPFILLISSSISVYYYIKMIKIAFFDTEAEEHCDNFLDLEISQYSDFNLANRFFMFLNTCLLLILFIDPGFLLSVSDYITMEMSVK